MDINDAIALATKELIQATREYGPLASPHEGYAVLKEELEELWEEIKTKPNTAGRHDKMKREAIQLAAMSLRFLMDVCEVDYEDYLAKMPPD